MIELFLKFAHDPSHAPELEAAIEKLLASAGKGPWKLVEKVEQSVRSQSPGQAFEFDADGFATLHHEEHSWKAGRFETPTIGAMKERANALKPGKHRLRLFVFTGAHPATDIGGLQATASPGTLFQAASQFNCLEAPGPNISNVADYFYDPTQGPRASISAFPGTLLRHYAAPGKGGKRFAQSNSRQINLLADVFDSQVGAVESGYLMASTINDPVGLINSLRANFDKIRVGVHEGLQVVLGQYFKGSVEASSSRLISQVFTSTFAGGMYSGRRMDSGNFIDICSLLLRGAYLGTLLAAATLKQHRAVLTLIGGGVFGNPIPLIWDSILWAIKEVEPYLSQDLDVIVNGRNLGDEVPEDRLLSCVKEWNGELLAFEGSGLPMVIR